MSENFSSCPPSGREHVALASPLPDAPRDSSFVWPVLVVVGGILLIAAAALLEERSQAGAPWRYALMARSGNAPWEGTIPIQVRKLPPENFPQSGFLKQVQSAGSSLEGVDLSSLELRESLVSADLPQGQWEALLDSGRVPAPGAREVLAGHFTRLDQFTINGETYSAVGRMKRATAGLAFSYLIPRAAALEEVYNTEAGGSTGWLDPEGQLREFTEEDQKRFEQEEQQVVVPLIPAARTPAIICFLGIGIVAVGGAFLQLRLLRRFNARNTVFCDIIDPLAQFPRVTVSIHVICYGAYFVTGLAAFLFPRANLQLLTFVTEVFTTGNLAELGQAYVSGNVMAAAWHTFMNNFIVVTVGSGVIPSLVLPFWGAFKTVLNLGVAGFAMAPLWADILARFTYHSVTRALEIEAYTIAAFAIVLYPVYMLRAFQSDDFLGGLKRTGAMVGWGTVLSGVLLLIAAFYEAITIIIIG
ncbi:MAG: stage II sporulation protein M [Candidatus Hydrogenedentes bacterium]|nr:stage II sporulation protein M [Candidatus Hydrogenedentota bacterium]